MGRLHSWALGISVKVLCEHKHLGRQCLTLLRAEPYKFTTDLIGMVHYSRIKPIKAYILAL